MFLNKFFFFFNSIGFLVFLINSLIILPIIFNFFVIPNIEKRLGKKLEFSRFIYWGKSSIWFSAHLDIGHSIFAKYLIWKIWGKVRVGNPKVVYALYQLNYDIREASKFEIIMSFWTTLNSLLFFAVIIGICFASN